MDFKMIIVLLASAVYMTVGTNVKKYNFKALVNTLNLMVNDKHTVPIDDFRIRAGFERYLEHICETYRHKGTYVNKYMKIKENTYSFIIYADRCNLEVRESSIAENFKDLVSLFNRIIHHKKIYKDNKVLYALKPLIKQYLHDVCFHTFKTSLAAQKCHIKQSKFNFGGCLYKLNCIEYDSNSIIHKKKVTGMFSIKDISKLDYCKGEVGLDCIKKCFNEADCLHSEYKVNNMCNAKYYYICVWFNGNYLPELHRCKYPLLFNGTVCA